MVPDDAEVSSMVAVGSADEFPGEKGGKLV
jgi:hypothetical protein